VTLRLLKDQLRNRWTSQQFLGHFVAEIIGKDAAAEDLNRLTEIFSLGTWDRDSPA
jgi:hypothetical protein